MRKALRSGATKTVRRRLPEASAGFVRAESPPTATGLEAELAELERLSLDDLPVGDQEARHCRSASRGGLQTGSVARMDGRIYLGEGGPSPSVSRSSERAVKALSAMARAPVLHEASRVGALSVLLRYRR
jgi:hypothetical protein